MKVTKDQIARDLRALGLENGDVVLMHSALSALGEVEGGADAVIDALLAVIGKEGTLAMPTMSSGVFRRESTPSNVGRITEVFRQRPGVLRSLHPTHSVAAIGPRASFLLKDHELSPTAVGPETPFGRLVELRGKVLLLGVDQDRNTLLHGAEEAVNAPYLSEHYATYIDDAGKEVTLRLERYPGPHRDFIGLEPRFRRAGWLRVGKVGQATARLMPAREVFEETVAALREDPAAVLCDNPACDDCQMQRGKIKAARLQQEEFTLAAVLDDPAAKLADVARSLRAQGIRHVEIGDTLGDHLLRRRLAEIQRFGDNLRDEGLVVSAFGAGLGRVTPGEDQEFHYRRFEKSLDLLPRLGTQRLRMAALLAGDDRQSATPGVVALLQAAARAASERNAVLVVENEPGTFCDTARHTEEILTAAGSPAVRVAFNPAHFAAVGDKPFLRVYYRGRIKRWMDQLYICDGLWDGTPTLPGRGNGEVKELISILRCRGFRGFFTLCPTTRGCFDPERLREEAERFWFLLDHC
jgi:aminoglycoside 3-N-acetyltransferase